MNSKLLYAIETSMGELFCGKSAETPPQIVHRRRKSVTAEDNCLGKISENGNKSLEMPKKRAPMVICGLAAH
jgi:hypothetical protein